MSARSCPARALLGHAGRDLLAGLALILATADLAACRGSGGPAAGDTAASAATSASASASAVVTANLPGAAPARRLELTGTYLVERAAIEMTREEGREAAWDQDDGTQGSGPGKLALTVDEQGTVRGTAVGALGAQGIRGVLDGDTLRLLLDPEVGREGSSFSGVVTAERRGEEFRGDLRASSGDSHLIRRGTVVLTRRSAP